jgi:predicted nucleic acid-binding protein
MIRAFIDASVLFSACLSSTGASREVMRYAIREDVTLVASELVFEEVRRNLATKAPEALPLLEIFLDTVPFETVTPSEAEVREAAQFTEFKDAPIVAAAVQADVDYLISRDRKHLVDVPEVEARSGIAVVLPEAALAEIRKRLEE